MPGRDWVSVRGGLGLLAVAGLVLTACGDSGAPSRRAASVAGSTTATEGRHDGTEAEVQGPVSDKAGACPTVTFKVGGIPVQTTAATEFKGFTCQTLSNTSVVEVEGQPQTDGTILAREVKLRAPVGAAPGGEVELQGVVAAKAGTCPTITFSVGGTAVGTDGKTKFEGKRCAQLANGDVVEVEGRRVNGLIRAREVKARTGPAAGAGAVTVALVGPVSVSKAAKRGEFEFEDLPPGTYNLSATVNGSPGCTVGLAAGIVLVGPDNEVEGRLVAGSGPCGIRLARLDVKPDKRAEHDDDEDDDDEDEDEDEDDDEDDHD